MRHRTVFMSFSLLGASALLTLACGGEAMPPAVPHYDADTLAMKRDVVYTLIQDLSCTDTTVCDSIAFGSKPCGGPRMNLVYSTATVNEQALSEAVADYNAYDAGFAAQEGTLSDCSLAPEARPACADGKCADTNPTP